MVLFITAVPITKPFGGIVEDMRYLSLLLLLPILLLKWLCLLRIRQNV